MNLRTMQKLEKLGYNKDWLTVVKSDWSPKKFGDYEMVITDVAEMGDDPRTGVFLERTRFSNDYDLSVILQFFEGNVCVITEVSSGNIVTEGYVEDWLFDEMEDWTGEDWDKFSEKELAAEKECKRQMKESLVDRLTRENQELMVENARLRLKLGEVK